MKRIAFILIQLFCFAGLSQAQNILTVADTNVPQGGQGEMVVGFQFANGEIASYQFDLVMPQGISLVPDGRRYKYEKGDGYNDAHQIVIGFTESKNMYAVTCASISDTYAFTVSSGTLIKFPLIADESLAKGTTLQATLENINLSTVRGTNISLDDVSFRIVIGDPEDIRTELYETDTEAPAAATDVNVRVFRTITANDWNTICLPFDMNESEVKAAFGDDVQLGDFTGYEASEDADGNIVGISVSFNNVNSIKANWPYIIKVSEAVSEFTVDHVDIDAAEEPVNATVKRTRRQWSEMIGTYVANTEVPEKTLFLNAGKFWYSTGLTKMKAFRAYFDFYDYLSSLDNASSRMQIVISNDTDGIDQVTSTKQDNTYYNLQGQQVVKPAKGVYVSNGKKVLVK